MISIPSPFSFINKPWSCLYFVYPSIQFRLLSNLSKLPLGKISLLGPRTQHSISVWNAAMKYVTGDGWNEHFPFYVQFCSSSLGHPGLEFGSLREEICQTTVGLIVSLLKLIIKMGIRGKAVLIIHLHFITSQLDSPTWNRSVEEAGGAHDFMESVLAEGQTVVYQSGEK